MWCPSPLPEREHHRRKVKSDKYQPLAGRLLEFYESDLSVEADEDTDAESGVDPDAGVMKSRRRTRSAVGKQSASAATAVVSAVKAAEKKKKRKRRAASPPAVVTPLIPTPHLREIESEEEEEESKKYKDEAIKKLPVPDGRPARRLESHAAKRQRELVQKMSEDALRCGLEAQRTTAAAQARTPATTKPRVFWSKTRLPAMTR
jgi:hypothetical protein